MGKILIGDNLEILKGIETMSVDLIYLDPPFNTGRNFGEYEDNWRNYPLYKPERADLESFMTVCILTSMEMLGYMSFMIPRMIELYRVLKKDGSIYVHCDPTVSHYMKVLMDKLFGHSNFRNEIIWKRATSTQKGSQHGITHWGNNSDTILFYGMSHTYGRYKLDPYRQLTEQEIREKFIHTDKDGRIYYDDSSHIWHNPGSEDRPTLCYEWRGFTNRSPAGWRFSKDTLEAEYQKGNIVILANGKLQRRKYLEDYNGVTHGNIWTDINPPSNSERTGYPTQKPKALLERIITASSAEGDVVLDPFSGSGTTAVVAEHLEREWIAIDVNPNAEQHLSDRLSQQTLKFQQ